MTEKELEVLATKSEAIDMLKDGFPLDDDIINRLEALGVDYKQIEEVFKYD